MGTSIAMTDGELLEASRRGERDAFGELVGRYQHVVCAVTYSRTRDQALSEDVAQETFLAAWKQLDQLREPGRLRSWLCGIARNLARKARRRSDRETPIEEPIVVAGESPFDAVCEAQAERVVSDALARVPETYREALVLYYREQRSARDVAAALGITEAAALQRLARGRQYLADGLTSLVERSLRAQRKPRRDLVAGVLAALPVIVDPFPVEASTASHVSHGGIMLKLALAAAVATAAGTTALVYHHTRDAAPAAAAAPIAAASATAAVSPGRVAAAPSTPSAPSAPSAPRPALPPDPRGAQPGAAPAAEPPAPPCGTCDPAPAAPPAERVAPDVIARLGLERGPSRGPATAPVTIAVFTDMKCKFCGSALGALDALLDEYPGKLRIVVKQLPLSAKHEVLSQGIFAAEAQGKFWELHDLMLANQDDLSRDTMLALAQEAGLDAGKLRAALDQGTYRAAVAADRAAAAELGVAATPSFFINGERITGLRPIGEFRAAIERALAAAP